MGQREWMFLEWIYILQAARNGHLDVLKWARDNGCPCNKSTCSETARNGHLEVDLGQR